MTSHRLIVLDLTTKALLVIGLIILFLLVIFLFPLQYSLTHIGLPHRWLWCITYLPSTESVAQDDFSFFHFSMLQPCLIIIVFEISFKLHIEGNALQVMAVIQSFPFIYFS